MTEQELNRLRGILKEHFQSFVFLGFDLEGEKIRMCDWETEVQGYAISSLVKEEDNCNTAAPEVWVRNMEDAE